MPESGLGWSLEAPLAYWRWMAAGWEACSAVAAGRRGIAERTASRFQDIVRHARARSRYYRDLYRDLPPEGVEPAQVPPTARRPLLARFDEWVTDAQVSRRSLERFLADPERVGRPYLGRYAAWTSSGTTGEPGWFVHDAGALAVYDALEMLRLGKGPFGAAFPGTVCDAAGRYAMIAATGGHFAGVASVERMRYLAPVLAGRMQVFSILQPLARLVAALNAYQPDLIATYPTAAALLAEEQEARRLDLSPSVIWLGGESLTAACRSRVQRVFGCAVFEEYGASECMSIACECRYGSLHVNSDWVLIEPVDRNYQPVAPGDVSHTVLLTNLANRVQPIIRYDLGDSVVLAPQPCACGSPFPVMRVEGRRDDVLTLHDGRGSKVRLLPLALTTVVEDSAGVHGFQIVQTGAAALAVRLAPGGEGVNARWDRAACALADYLGTQGLSNVAIAHDPAPPERDTRSGKLRRIVNARAPRSDAPA